MFVIVNYKNGQQSREGICHIYVFENGSMYLYELFSPIPKIGLGTWMIYKLLEYIDAENKIHRYFSNYYKDFSIRLETHENSVNYFSKLGFEINYILKDTNVMYNIKMKMNIGKLIDNLKNISNSDEPYRAMINNKKDTFDTIDGLSDEEIIEKYADMIKADQELNDEEKRCIPFNNKDSCISANCYYDEYNNKCKPTYLFITSHNS